MSCLHQHSQLNLIVSRADMLYHNVLASLLFHDLHSSRTRSSSHTTNKRGHTPIIDTRLVTHPHTTNHRFSTKTRTPTPENATTCTSQVERLVEGKIGEQAVTTVALTSDLID